MRLTLKELDAIATALAELLAGEGPQGVDDPDESREIMDAAESAQAKVVTMIAKRKRH